jgi:serine phosphatase RsbU (regulator of sigma subunit)
VAGSLRGVSPTALTPAPREGGTGRGTGPHLLTVIVLVSGLAITAALSVVSEISYRHNEQRLTNLESKLAGSLLASAPTQAEAQLGRVAGLVAGSSTPVATFTKTITPSLAPFGPYASAVLVAANDGPPRVLSHVGAASLRSSQSAASQALFERAAGMSSLVTTRVVARKVQRLGYLMSADGNGTTFVVGASQQLPVNDRIHLPSGVIASSLDFAVYYGRHPNAASLIGSNAQTPLTGVVSSTTDQFGTSTITLLVAARGSLAGPWSEYLPWAILLVGILFSGLAALTTERLVRRRTYAEWVASSNRDLYNQQRDIAVTMQQALLPKNLPEVPGVDLAARYIPASTGAQIGGDWYSLINVSEEDIVFVVGDVSGHGITAASVMGSMRYMTRSLARLGCSPSEILDRTNREIDIRSDDHFATVLIGAFSLGKPEVVLASAGHLPPLMISATGSYFADLPAGPPLGVVPHVYQSKALSFPPGTTLLGYTDGLVEQRDCDIDVGQSKLVAAARHTAPTASTLLDEIVEALMAEDNEDDVALLAIRR